MKTVINTIPLLSPLTGIGKYTYEISKRIKNEFDTEFYYGYFSRNLIEHNQSSSIKNVKALIDKFPILKKVARKSLQMIKSYKTYDLYWEPNFIPLNNIKAKKIITTVHDFSFYKHPHWHPKEKLLYFKNNFWKNIKRSDCIITDSYYIKKEVMKYLKFDENKIKVIHLGIDHDIFKIYNKLVLEQFKIKNNLPDRFILFVGSIEPRKNLLNLLKAYNQLPIHLKNEYSLLLVGFKGWENKEIMNLIEKNRKYIKYLGYLADKELAYIYNLATLFVYPSFYEGFGLPPLEAMACGTPVLVSDSSSIPEICAKAAVYCNPYNIYDIKDKIALVLENVSLRETLIKEGLKRASLFNWDISAKKHLEIFKSC